MENHHIMLIGVLILAIAAIVLAIIKLDVFLLRFNSKTRLIARKMRRAEGMDEYNRWHRALRCHYLCLIPFVTEKNVDALYQLLYYKPKYMAPKERSDGLNHILAPSVLGIVLCGMLLSGVSWAWFTASGSSGVSAIQSATYTVSVAIEQDGISEPVAADENGVYTLRGLERGTYVITITAVGSANTGYCKVELADREYYTQQIGKGSSSQFFANINAGDVLTITRQWGTCVDSVEKIDDQDTIGTLEPVIPDAPDSDLPDDGEPGADVPGDDTQEADDPQTDVPEDVVPDPESDN